QTAANPLLAACNAPFGVPPLDEVKPEHFPEAFAQALSEHSAEVAAVVADPAAPTFENTVEALERSGRLLARVTSVFYVLAGAHTYVLPLGSDDLAGLPDFAKAAARGAAKERGLTGGYAVTLSRSSVEPFLQFSARRELREKAFRAWIARGDHAGNTDNK